MQNEIKFVDLGRQYNQIKKECDSAIQEVLNKSNFILGEEVETFETNFARYVGSKYCVGVNSGTDALILAIRALNLEPQSEVLVPANTFIATSHSIVANDLKPVFVDIDLNDNGFLLSDLKKKITSKTRLILPVHLYGQPDKLDQIYESIEGKNIKLIEDACQSHGAYYKSRITGSIGELGCFSFYPGKNLGAFGDAGAITTNSESLFSKLKTLRNFGSNKKYYHDEYGVNSRLDTIQAAVLSVKLKFLNEWNHHRQQLAKEYTNGLKGLEAISTPNEYGERRSVYHLYVIRTKSRDKLLSYLNSNSIRAQIHYPLPLHLQSCYKYLGYKVGDLPNAELAANEVISLPIFPYMSLDEVKRICSVIQTFCLSDVR